MRFATAPGYITGEQFFQYLKDSFDTLYAEGQAGAAKMFSIGLHNRLIGRPARWRGWRGSWITRCRMRACGFPAGSTSLGTGRPRIRTAALNGRARWSAHALSNGSAASSNIRPGWRSGPMRWNSARA